MCTINSAYLDIIMKSLAKIYVYFIYKIENLYSLEMILKNQYSNRCISVFSI